MECNDCNLKEQIFYLYNTNIVLYCASDTTHSHMHNGDLFLDRRW